MMNRFQFPSADVYTEMGMLDIYDKCIKGVSSLNGCKLYGIMEFDGVLLHLERSLLYSDPVCTKESFKKLLAGEKEVCKHYIVGNLSSPELFVEGSRDVCI